MEIRLPIRPEWMAQNGKAPLKNKNDTTVSSAEELPALSKLRHHPLPAPTSNGNIAKLLRHTGALSPSGGSR